jgi:hypothetical protein
MRKVLVNVFAGDLAGGGSASMYRASRSGLEKLSASHGFELLNVSPKKPDSPYEVQFSYETRSYGPRHKQACVFADDLMKQLSGCDVRIFSWGYTSFMPFAFSEYVKRGDVKVVWGDSSPPDTDIPGEDIESSRFFAEAYRGTMQMLWSWHDFNEADPRLLARMPCNVPIVKSSRPFSEDYVDHLKAVRDEERSPMRKEFGIREQDVAVLVGSSDIWSGSAVGNWMTREQSEDVHEKTRFMIPAIEAMGGVLGLEGRSLKVFADPALQQVYYLRSENADVSFAHHEAYRYHRLLRAADGLLVRTTNCVTSAEAAFLGTPQNVTLMPAKGYMNVEVFAEYAVQRSLCKEVGFLHALSRASMGMGRENAECAFLEAERFRVEHDFFSKLGKILLV